MEFIQASQIVLAKQSNAGEAVEPALTLGITRKWTGACGLLSSNASALSSSYSTFAGISFDMILSKIVGCPWSAFCSALR